MTVLLEQPRGAEVLRVSITECATRTDRDRIGLARAFAAAGLTEIAERLRDLRPMPPNCWCFRGLEPTSGWVCATCRGYVQRGRACRQ